MSSSMDSGDDGSIRGGGDDNDTKMQQQQQKQRSLHEYHSPRWFFAEFIAQRRPCVIRQHSSSSKQHRHSHQSQLQKWPNQQSLNVAVMAAVATDTAEATAAAATGDASDTDANVDIIAIGNNGATGTTPKAPLEIAEILVPLNGFSSVQRMVAVWLLETKYAKSKSPNEKPNDHDDTCNMVQVERRYAATERFGQARSTLRQVTMPLASFLTDYCDCRIMVDVNVDTDAKTAADAAAENDGTPSSSSSSSIYYYYLSTQEDQESNDDDAQARAPPPPRPFWSAPCRILRDAHCIPSSQLALAGHLRLYQCQVWMGNLPLLATASSSATATTTTTSSTSSGAGGATQDSTSSVVADDSATDAAATTGPGLAADDTTTPTQVYLSHSGLHHDYHDNFYTVLAGCKEFILYPPHCARHLALAGTIECIYPNGLISYRDAPTYADGRPKARAKEYDEVQKMSARNGSTTSTTIPNNNHTSIGKRKRDDDKCSAAAEAETEEADNDDESDDEESVVLGRGFDYQSSDDENDDEKVAAKMPGDNDDNENDDYDQYCGGDDDFDNLEEHDESQQQATKTNGVATASTKSPTTTPPSSSSSLPNHFSYIDPVYATSREAIIKTFPSYARCLEHESRIRLLAGDTLYLPAGWFHCVISSPAPESDDKDEAVAKHGRDEENGTDVSVYVPPSVHMAINYWYHPPDNLTDFDHPYTNREFWDQPPKPEQQLKSQS